MVPVCRRKLALSRVAATGRPSTPGLWRKSAIAEGQSGAHVDFSLTDDQEMLKTLVERFVRDRYDPAKRAAYRASECGYSVENWRLLAELGLFTLPFSEEGDGVSGVTTELIAVVEALGRGLVVEPLMDMILIGGATIAAAGTPEQKAARLPGIVSGEKCVALAYAEQGARFKLVGGDARVTARGLSGAKTFVAGGADAWIVTALSDEGPGLWLVPADAPGVTRRGYQLIDGSPACELTFENVEAEPLPGGMAALAPVLDTARIAACAEMIGIMGRLLDETLSYVTQRRQFGTPIGSFQAIQHRLADQYVALELARSQLYRGATAGSQDAVAAIAGAKSFIAQKAVALGEECIQLHGGMGVSDELSIGHGHKRILLLASLFGDSDHELHRYAAALRERSTAGG